MRFIFIATLFFCHIVMLACVKNTTLDSKETTSKTEKDSKADPNTEDSKSNVNKDKTHNYSFTL